MAHVVRSTFGALPIAHSADAADVAVEHAARRTVRCACQTLFQFPTQSATLAGLLQDVGVLPILHVLNKYHEQLTNEAHVLSAIDKFAPPVGTILLTRWGFDADTVEAARSRRDWLRNPHPSADLADLVLVARLHADIA